MARACGTPHVVDVGRGDAVTPAGLLLERGQFPQMPPCRTHPARSRQPVAVLDGGTPASTPVSPVRSAHRRSSTAPACPTSLFPSATTHSRRSHPVLSTTRKASCPPRRIWPKHSRPRSSTAPFCHRGVRSPHSAEYPGLDTPGSGPAQTTIHLTSSMGVRQPSALSKGTDNVRGRPLVSRAWQVISERRRPVAAQACPEHGGCRADRSPDGPTLPSRRHSEAARLVMSPPGDSHAGGRRS